jgi:hypothetical protein
VDLSQRGGDSLLEVSIDVLLDQVSQNLRIGVRGQTVTTGDESGTECAMILDDAVVDDGQASRTVGVRMRVPVRGYPVGGPARVSDSYRPGDRHLVQVLFQPDNLALSLSDDQTISVNYGEAGRVIAAVFKAFQARDQDLGDITGTDVADYSTHGSLLIKRSAVWLVGGPVVHQFKIRSAVSAYGGFDRWAVQGKPFGGPT